ncbi:hypothetical protein [Flammeovirga agarivorans]|uniref:Uncharacterized protein n=1 Tax=Flammeovirga agarivorans TaxID=2726742 RepID=A0A7X8SR66_9BACT|nr:hypothetical protein [Flammeovirga agarivorans]NLR94870.1 hypothetical protein [Flammeovirga agarivorans]
MIVVRSHYRKGKTVKVRSHFRKQFKSLNEKLSHAKKFTKKNKKYLRLGAKIGGILIGSGLAYKHRHSLDNAIGSTINKFNNKFTTSGGSFRKIAGSNNFTNSYTDDLGRLRDKETDIILAMPVALKTKIKLPGSDSSITKSIGARGRMSELAQLNKHSGVAYTGEGFTTKPLQDMLTDARANGKDFNFQKMIESLYDPPKGSPASLGSINKGVQKATLPESHEKVFGTGNQTKGAEYVNDSSRASQKEKWAMLMKNKKKR